MSIGTNAPNGFQPVRKLDGSAWTGATNSYQIANAYATALYRGDPVTILADGTLGVGVAGAACVGVFWGVKFIDNTGRVRFENFWPGNPGVLTGSTVEALVIDDPDTVFSVQETNNLGAAGTNLTLADVGLNINFLYTAGTPATGNSAVSIDNTTDAVTSTLNCKILSLDPTPGNAVGAFANWLVIFNNHRYRSGIAGV